MVYWNYFNFARLSGLAFTCCVSETEVPHSESKLNTSVHRHMFVSDVNSWIPRLRWYLVELQNFLEMKFLDNFWFQHCSDTVRAEPAGIELFKRVTEKTLLS